MTRTLKIGLLGCGVVGRGVVEALQQCQAWIAGRNEVQFEIMRIAVRDLLRSRGPSVRREWLCNHWRQVCEADDVDVVVEVMGGLEPALEAVVTALTNGKHVVTANKELLAAHGDELQRLADEHNCFLLYEASVLGGVPVLHGLETYFRANRITGIRGIVNGTCNYILTRMEEDGIRFAEALSEAQSYGFAEADPTMDIESFDALYKLEILIRLALQAKIDVRQVERIGVTGVEECDIALARQIGCRVQQIATAELEDEAVRASVGPAFVPLHDPLSRIQGVDNGLCVEGTIVGRVVFSGPGAGAFPTASAVVEDLVKVVTGLPHATRESVPMRVTFTQPEAYFVRRHCEPSGECLGPLATGSIPDSGVRIGGYVRTPDSSAEGWIIFGTRASLHEVVDLLRKFDGSSIAWYPFTQTPKVNHRGRELGETPVRASV